MFAPDTVVEIGSKGSPEGAVKQINFPYDPVFDEEERGGPLEVKEPQSFLYDEWDYRMSDYRPRWCLLREKEMAEGDGTFFNTTLEGYSLLASQIKRQFEMVVPQASARSSASRTETSLSLTPLSRRWWTRSPALRRRRRCTRGATR